MTAALPLYEWTPEETAAAAAELRRWVDAVREVPNVIYTPVGRRGGLVRIVRGPVRTVLDIEADIEGEARRLAWTVYCDLLPEPIRMTTVRHAIDHALCEVGRRLREAAQTCMFVGEVGLEEDGAAVVAPPAGGAA